MDPALRLPYLFCSSSHSRLRQPVLHQNLLGAECWAWHTLNISKGGKDSGREGKREEGCVREEGRPEKGWQAE